MNGKKLLRQVIGLTSVLLLLVACSTPAPTPTATPAPTSTPTPNPTPTPIGGGRGQIAFVSNRDGNAEIYVMQADGSAQTNLTNHESKDDWPAMSPDGTRLAFISDRDEPHPDTCKGQCNSEIYAINTDGADLTRLTEGPEYEMFPAWSPDGTQIAFNSSRDPGFDLFVMAVDGSDLANPTGHKGVDLYPTWMPEGAIVFLSLRDGGFQFYQVNADGSDLSMLDSGLPASDPSQSGKVGFMVTEGYMFFSYVGSIYDLQTFQDSGSSLGEFPAWSPDGTHIVFHSRRDGNREIYTVNADLSNLKRLTDNAAEDAFSTWSPDGSQIAFQSDRDGNLEIYVMNADGTNLRNLTNNPADDTLPTWYP